MTEDRGSKALSAAVNALMEYFDTVQIFVAKDKNDEMTIGQTLGKGSLFARVGQVGLWLSKVENNLVNGEPDVGEPDDDEQGTKA